MMKRLALFLVLLCYGLDLKAQTNLQEAVDFVATDVNGHQVHLFDILDRGRFVLIDFFSYGCSGCEQTTPALVEAYSYFGCNLHEVFIMEISCTDNDSILERWRDNFNVEYPTIGCDGGGDAVFSAYNIKACPSIVLINPDHSIAARAMYPFSLNDVINQLTPYGIRQHDCVITECFSPQNFTAELVEDKVFLNWDRSFYADFYIVYKDGNRMAEVSANGFSDGDLCMSVDYCYKVTAICDHHLESDPSDEVCVTIPYDKIVGVEKQVFTCYPNPTSDRLTLEGEGMRGVQVVSILGQVVYDANIQGDHALLDLSEVDEGVYLVMVKSEKVVIVQRIAIIR
ncbi:MAG: T9SS type A sorting domain-containing protein [Paludibacteraceae bacterium]|nr:T9SS type A sorting domain-containing protein [Paludibacteraceae bacterium]